MEIVPVDTETMVSHVSVMLTYLVQTTAHVHGMIYVA